MKKFFLIAVIGLLVIPHSFSQSADSVTEIIKTASVTYGQVAYLAGTSLGIINDNDSYDTAVEEYKKAGLIAEDISATDAIKLKNIAFILSKTWNVKPTLMSRIFKDQPRYALRSFQAAGIIDILDDPDKLCSGHEFLNIVTECTEFYEVLDSGAFYSKM